jgi:hypothetical protein
MPCLIVQTDDDVLRSIPIIAVSTYSTELQETKGKCTGPHVGIGAAEPVCSFTLLA